jgi:hypothetical protein
LCFQAKGFQNLDKTVKDYLLSYQNLLLIIPSDYIEAGQTFSKDLFCN